METRISVLSTREAIHSLSKIVALKANFWPYPQASQIAWFEKNVLPKDWHIFATVPQFDLVGYAHISTSQADIGIVQNVCVERSLQRGGVGSQIMCAVNDILRKNVRRGLLSCAAEIATFYEKCGWSGADQPGEERYRRHADEVVLSFSTCR